MTLEPHHSFADGALTLERRGETAVLTLNRPAVRNAVSRAMWSALPAVVEVVESDAACKLLLVTGAGGHFAAGADIAEFEIVYASRESSADYAQTLASAVRALAGLSKPSLAAIRGACVGAGMALALACDLRLAATDARLGVTPARLGLMYSLADTKRLVDTIGSAASRDILYTGRLLDAAEAASLGLVSSIHAPDALDEAVAAKADAISTASQWSIRRAKAVMGMILAGATEDTAQTRNWFVDAVEGEDFREGRDAFLGKRIPEFPFR